LQATSQAAARSPRERNSLHRGYAKGEHTPDASPLTNRTAGNGEIPANVPIDLSCPFAPETSTSSHRKRATAANFFSLGLSSFPFFRDRRGATYTNYGEPTERRGARDQRPPAVTLTEYHRRQVLNTRETRALRALVGSCKANERQSLNLLSCTRS